MAKFNSKAVAEMKEVFNKAQYIKREWKTDEECTMTLSEYAELIDTTMAHIAGNPVIIAKERKDGNIFLKMWIPLQGDSGVEYDLSFENDFEEGDEIDKDSLDGGILNWADRKWRFLTHNFIYKNHYVPNLVDGKITYFSTTMQEFGMQLLHFL
jgi:Fe-S cluster assembly iron-binding protein IscA